VLSAGRLSLSLFLLLSLFLPSCSSPGEGRYRKVYTAVEQRELARHLAAAVGTRNQGTPAEQMLLREAQRLDPYNATVYQQLGDPYLYRGLVTAFPNYYGKAVELDPLAWTGWRGYLYLYVYRDYARALADFDATDTITPGVVDYPQSTSVDYMRGICYLQLGQYDRAIEYFDRHIDREIEVVGPRYIAPETFLYRGIAYLGQADTTAALASFAAGRELTPRNADLHYWSAKVHLEQGNLALAQRHLNRATAEFSARNYNRRFYGEPFYALYSEDLAELRDRIAGEAPTPPATGAAPF
jgi:tetratricopeptide (TPR) repeat protein